jgi:hypothetical protein
MKFPEILDQKLTSLEMELMWFFGFWP